MSILRNDFSRGKRVERGDIEALVEKVRQAAYDLHVYLGNGLLEKVYENGLKHRLEKMGLKVEAQKNLKVYDEDGFEIGDYYADLFINDGLIVELKATKTICPEHLAQTLNYLKITNMPEALIINFGSYQFESRIVHSLRSPRLNDSLSSPCSPRSPRLKDSPSSPCSSRSPRLNNLSPSTL